MCIIIVEENIYCCMLDDFKIVFCFVVKVLGEVYYCFFVCGGIFVFFWCLYYLVEIFDMYMSVIVFLVEVFDCENMIIF